MNVYTEAAIEHILAAAISLLVIWFHHEWYWILACYFGYAFITPEIKQK